MYNAKQPISNADIIVSEVGKRMQDHVGVFVIGIDGKSGTGKTTISKEVADRLDAVNILCDNFFSGGDNAFWSAKTNEEKTDLAIDWKRIQKEVILPLKLGKKAIWHPFDWDRFEGLSKKVITAEPKKLLFLMVHILLERSLMM